MKHLLLTLVIVLSLVSVATAQEAEVTPEAESDPPVERGLVIVESAFIRAMPDFDAEPVASAFENEILEIVGRNLDGKWFEVRRPYRMNNLGWIFNEMVEWDFAPELLPLGDLTTGVTGPQPLAEPVDAAVWIVEGVALRDAPRLRGERILNIPPNVAVPVLARNADGSWLRVNYLGNEGWIIGFTARDRADLLEIVPLDPNAPPPDTPPVVVIPVELQLAQAERLRTYMVERRDYARHLVGFWGRVFRGEVMPCDEQPPVPEYAVTDQDIRELPEIDRYLPRLGTGVDRLNSSIAPFDDCGIITPTAASRARNDAINASIIFEATIERLDNLVENVIQ